MDDKQTNFIISGRRMGKPYMSVFASAHARIRELTAENRRLKDLLMEWCPLHETEVDEMIKGEASDER